MFDPDLELDGQCRRGNRVLLRAVVNPPAEAVNVASVQFEYRPLNTGGFIPVPAANSTTHPNPDTTGPFFVHWDVSGLTNNQIYEVRAVSTNIHGLTDPAPVAIAFAFTTSCARFEYLNPSNETEVSTNVFQGQDNVITGGHEEEENLVKVMLPNGSLTSDGAFTITSLDPDQFLPTLNGLQPINHYVRLAINNGQGGASFAGDLNLKTFPITPEVTFEFPDRDNDGIEDTYGIGEDALRVYRLDTSVIPNQWVEMPGLTLDDLLNQLTVNIDRLGTYGVFRSPNAAEDWTRYE